MVLTVYFKPEHDSNWYTGYDFNCVKHYQKSNYGPKNGTRIKIKNLPVNSSKHNYLRFWAAKKKKGSKVWKTSSQAYNEDSEIETEPAFNYFNSGFVKINRLGVADIKLQLPSSYINNMGVKESPHIHFRICSGDKMSPVYTLPLSIEKMNL